MQNNQISKLIALFVANTYSKSIQNRFRVWITDGRNCAEKENSLNELWNKCNAVPTKQTTEELRKLHRLIAVNDKSLVNRHKRIMRHYRNIAAIIMLVILCTSATFILTRSYIEREPQLVEHYNVTNQSEQIMLEDGSQIFLQANSMIIYSSNLKRSKSRIVYLNGEAKFNVAKNLSKPFIVKTKYMDVQALGTIFNVCSYDESSNVSVVLEEGKVKVGSKAFAFADAILNPNERLVYDTNKKSISIESLDEMYVGMLSKGFLIFNNDEFEDILDAIKHRYNVNIINSYKNDQNRRLSVKFSSDEDIRDVMKVLSKMLNGMKYEIREDKNIFIY